MRVALMTGNALARNAIGNQVAEKLAFFLERGAEVRVVVQSADRLHPDVEPYCHVLPRAQTHGPAWEFLAGADLVIADYSEFYDLLNLLPALADGKGRIVLDYHGVTPARSWPAQHAATLEQAARQRGLVWCADAALAHSRFACRELLQATGFPADRVTQLAYPFDLNTFGDAGAHPSFRKRLGLDQTVVLLVVGRVAPNKGISTLVEALDELRESRPPIHAVVIGDATDIYAEEATRCRELARRLQVTDRLHFLGQVAQQELVEAYHSTDILVIPSVHEGFCMPVIEAMACGLPVIAARATALPETVADAGLTFHPGDPRDLARQVCRVLGDDRITPTASSPHPLTPSPSHTVIPPRSRVAIVSVRYGTDFAGGAETSLRTIAETLHRAGHAVDVFTTCTRSENHWSNDLPAGTSSLHGVPVHRFPVDAGERERHLRSVQAIVQAEGHVEAGVAEEYVRYSLHSTALLDAVRQRIGSLDALVVGPYLFGLTCDVAREFPGKTLLLPCFHDEPFARLQTWVQAYESVGGILYHTREEQDFAQAELGINHPRAFVIGSLVDTELHARAESDGNVQSAGFGRYLAYCGRYSQQKRLGQLVDFARRYHAERPQRFRFVFVGQGEVRIPREAWALDCGFLDQARKRAMLAGADALVQLSRQESLSLVALEAWAQGTPVIADAHCTALAGHLRRSHGGRAIESYEEFAQALDDLWEHPQSWRELGRQGQEYVRSEYGSIERFTQRLQEAVGSLAVPLREQMRRRGLWRAQQFRRDTWREQLSEFVDNLLHAARPPSHSVIEVRLHQQTIRAAVGTRTTLVAVQLIQQGTQAALVEGPARTVVCAQVLDAETRRPICARTENPLPGLIVPGKPQAAALSVVIPDSPGCYQIALWARRADQAEPVDGPPSLDVAPTWLDLVVEAGPAQDKACCAPLLDVVHNALAEAHDKQSLPDDYVDVTQGLLAPMKKRIKRKLLGNFKHAYVDVLSRQQSAVNRQLVTAVQHLTQCCATLDHAVRVLQERVDRLSERLVERHSFCSSAGIAMNEEEPSDQASRPA